MHSLNIDVVLDRLTSALEQQVSLETLVRPLLALMEEMTGMESVYLTHIDWDARAQQVIYSKNQQKFAVPEGLTVPLAETLCARAIEERHFVESDVPTHWSDATAAQAMGIQTYFSAPVMSPPTEIFGTLCAISPRRVNPPATSLKLLHLAADMISGTIERERLIKQLHADSQAMSRFALTDPLTQLPNRRALMRSLARGLAKARRLGLFVLVAFVDLDGFKHINDVHGHDAGDQFLQQFSQRLSLGLRGGDFIGRFGGDEFVISTLLEASDEAAAAAEVAGLIGRLTQLTQGEFSLGEAVLDYPGASIGSALVKPDGVPETIEQVIARADAAMYTVKKQRHGGR